MASWRLLPFDSFALRGFTQDIGTAPSVAVYFAEVVALRGPTGTTKAGDGAGPGYFYDLQNVQVLKGPQGTLFGRNTTGGAILFVPRKPTDTFDGYLEASVGNYDMRRLQGAINIPLGDTARFRVAGDYMKRDGYLRNYTDIGPRGFNDINQISLRASLVADLTPDLENYTIVSFTDSKTNGSVQQQPWFRISRMPPTGARKAGGPGVLRCGQHRSGSYGQSQDLADHQHDDLEGRR